VLRKRGKGYSLVRHAVAPLASGIVADGEVLDVEALSAAIRDMWDREGLKVKTVAIGVANQRCVLRAIELPRIKSKSALREAISFEVADNLPIPIEDAVFGFHTVGAFKDDSTGIERQRHIVVMSYRESMERFHDAILGAGLKARYIDLAGFALMRAGLRSVHDQIAAEQSAQPDVEHAPTAIALCDIGSASTNLVISRDGVCELNRMVGVGARLFAATLAEQFGWSEEDAERVKNEAGVMPLGGVESPGDPYTDSRRVMQFVADQIAAELRTSFDFYHHASDNQYRVNRVILAGEGALLRGIEERFASELNMPVSILDASPHLDAGSVEELGVNHAHLATALGLAMEDAA
jgi:type IV pilus assembly protein PilM